MNAAKIRLAASGLIAGIAILTLSACNSSQDAAPANNTPAVPTTSTTTQQPAPPAPAQVADPGTKAQKPAAPATPVLGPRGYGKLTLGMTAAQAKATGLIGETTTPAKEFCQAYPILGLGESSNVFISRDRGIESIFVSKNVRTPEGVTLGWTPAKVKKVYPDLDLALVEELSRDLLPAPGSAGAAYRIGFHNGVVREIALQMGGQKCYE